MFKSQSILHQYRELCSPGVGFTFCSESLLKGFAFIALLMVLMTMMQMNIRVAFGASPSSRSFKIKLLLINCACSAFPRQLHHTHCELFAVETETNVKTLQKNQCTLSRIKDRQRRMATGGFTPKAGTC